ncbi:MAG: sirohydrochlorin chelatase [Actinomyces sp.]|uniref:sirohydrochlorin chelatase n=1 Tax=Actinomyces sp. TaxID=29317 RepID=UPI0026DC50BE|nr:sirohydrochlorin chelatase [Actinomyces sp.]MDO4243701.1 sirohydrochlorin chelatase [Actinomyces sp.]
MNALPPLAPRPVPRTPTRPPGGHGPEPHAAEHRPGPRAPGHGRVPAPGRRHEPAAPAAGRSLVLLAHGSGHPAGREVVEDITGQVAHRLRGHGTRVTLGFLREMTPSPAQALAGTEDPVVLPLFLGQGYHVRVDIPHELRRHGSGQIVPHLGASPRLVEVLSDRLDQAGARPGDGVVLAAAGSSDPGAVQEVHALAEVLGARLRTEVGVGFLSAATPDVREAVASLRAQGHRRVVVSSLLLSDGVFQQALSRAGADVVTAPLGAHREIVEAVLEGYRAAAGPLGDIPVDAAAGQEA